MVFHFKAFSKVDLVYATSVNFKYIYKQSFKRILVEISFFFLRSLFFIKKRNI